MTGWAEGTGPWIPVIRDGRLYGRGGADDGCAVFASIAALRALQQEKRPHARTVILIECCEESGSVDLPAYLEVLTEGVHSGDASGVVASSFRIARQLLERVEEAATGRVRFDAGQAISASRRCGWARAARSRSWRCSARNSRRRSS